jgi:hypothetical protein
MATYIFFLVNVFLTDTQKLYVSGSLCDISMHLHTVHISQIRHNYLLKHLLFICSENFQNIFFWIFEVYSSVFVSIVTLLCSGTPELLVPLKP